jgi:spoIIIJ-associated protein
MSMTDPIEVTAATVEEAIKQALEKLGAPGDGVTEDDVTIEVLATPRAGVLGLGARQAKIRVTLRPQAAATSGVQSPPPAPPRPSHPETPPAQRPERRDERREDRKEDRKDDRREDRRQEYRPDLREDRRGPRPQQPPARPQAAQQQPPRPPREPRDDREREHGGDSDENPDAPRRSANLEQQAAEATEILLRILELMGENGQVSRVVETDPDSLELEIKGDGSGLLIGRHGQTLDALEYVVNRIVARRIRDAVPIMLETEAYRARRRQQLHRMALSMGERAKREHQSVMLEPMPPRDRRVIHLALKEDPMLTTRSSGEGFLRAIEIVPVGAPRQGRGGDGPGPAPGPGRGGRRRERDNREKPRERPNDALGEQGGFKHGQKRIV